MSSSVGTISSIAAPDLDHLLAEMDDPAPVGGGRALTDAWVLLSRVPENDPLYPRVSALLTVTDALIRVEDVACN
jgi:hypothetical protein